MNEVLINKQETSVAPIANNPDFSGLDLPAPEAVLITPAIERKVIDPQMNFPQETKTSQVINLYHYKGKLYSNRGKFCGDVSFESTYQNHSEPELILHRPGGFTYRYDKELQTFCSVGGTRDGKPLAKQVIIHNEKPRRLHEINIQPETIFTDTLHLYNNKLYNQEGKVIGTLEVSGDVDGERLNSKAKVLQVDGRTFEFDPTTRKLTALDGSNQGKTCGGEYQVLLTPPKGIGAEEFTSIVKLKENHLHYYTAGDKLYNHEGKLIGSLAIHAKGSSNFTNGELTGNATFTHTNGAKYEFKFNDDRGEFYIDGNRTVGDIQIIQGLPEALQRKNSAKPPIPAYPQENKSTDERPLKPDTEETLLAQYRKDKNGRYYGTYKDGKSAAYWENGTWQEYKGKALTEILSFDATVSKEEALAKLLTSLPKDWAGRAYGKNDTTYVYFDTAKKTWVAYNKEELKDIAKYQENIKDLERHPTDWSNRPYRIADDGKPEFWTGRSWKIYSGAELNRIIDFPCEEKLPPETTRGGRDWKGRPICFKKDGQPLAYWDRSKSTWENYSEEALSFFPEYHRLTSENSRLREALAQDRLTDPQLTKLTQMFEHVLKQRGIDIAQLLVTGTREAVRELLIETFNEIGDQMFQDNQKRPQLKTR